MGIVHPKNESNLLLTVCCSKPVRHCFFCFFKNTKSDVLNKQMFLLITTYLIALKEELELDDIRRTDIAICSFSTHILYIYIIYIYIIYIYIISGASQ